MAAPGIVKRFGSSVTELLGDAQLPMRVLLRCSVDGKMQSDTQQVGRHVRSGCMWLRTDCMTCEAAYAGSM
jgi:hypothetical protein